MYARGCAIQHGTLNKIRNYQIKKSKIFLEHSNKIGLKEYYEDKMRIQTKNYGDTVISVFQTANN